LAEVDLCLTWCWRRLTDRGDEKMKRVGKFAFLTLCCEEEVIETRGETKKQLQDEKERGGTWTQQMTERIRKKNRGDSRGGQTL